VTTRPLLVSILLALVWTGAAIVWIRALDQPKPVPAPATAPVAEPRTFVIKTDHADYVIKAHEVITDGFCTTFVLGGVRIAGVCGQHTWSEAHEEESLEVS
jgi:hypothetical protein